MPARRHPIVRRPRMGALAAAVVVAGVLAVASGAGAAGGDRVLVFGRWGTFSPAARTQTASHLRNLGHDVAVADSLPADLSTFDGVWFVGLQPLTTAEVDALVDYAHAGGGVYLAGEATFSSIWVALDASLQAVVDGVVGPGFVLDGASVAGPYAFNPGATGDVAAGLATLPGVTSSVGRMSGVAGANVLLTAALGAPVGAVWDGTHVPGGGRIVVVLDLTWMTLTTTSTAMVMDRFQEFLGRDEPPAANVAPQVVVTSPEEGAAVPVGVPLALLATVVDPDGHTVSCAVDWGDGTASTVGAAAGACGDAHAYDAAGLRTVTVTATDDDGGSSSASSSVAVFDPAAGSLAGGGRLGGGNLSVAVRYHDGEPRPSGHLRWSMGRNGSSLVATAFDWMVVGPDGVVVIEGTASTDGTGDRRFRLTATPGRGAGAASVSLAVEGAAAASLSGELRGALTVHR